MPVHPDSCDRPLSRPRRRVSASASITLGPTTSIHLEPRAVADTSTEYYDMIERELYSAVVADVLDELGHRDQHMRSDIRPLHDGAKIVGRAATLLVAEVFEAPKEPYKLELEMLDNVKTGEVLVLSTPPSRKVGIFGELMATRAQVLGGRGAVIDGLTRDVLQLIDMKFPVFCAGASPADANGRLDVIGIRVPSLSEAFSSTRASSSSPTPTAASSCRLRSRKRRSPRPARKSRARTWCETGCSAVPRWLMSSRRPGFSSLARARIRCRGHRPPPSSRWARQPSCRAPRRWPARAGGAAGSGLPRTGEAYPSSGWLDDNPTGSGPSIRRWAACVRYRFGGLRPELAPGSSEQGRCCCSSRPAAPAGRRSEWPWRLGHRQPGSTRRRPRPRPAPAPRRRAPVSWRSRSSARNAKRSPCGDA